MNIDKLERDLNKIVSNLDEGSFIYNLLQVYELPQASITRLKKGDYNLSKKPGEILWKKRVCFRVDKSGDLHTLIDSLQKDKNITKHHPRFIIVTDFKEFLAVDTKNGDSLDISFKELHKYYDFFLPWAGMEKSQLQSENPADIKAAEKMGKLYDLILEDNQVSSDVERHALNVFLSRLLFCFFAEDTGIFDDDQFTNAIASHTSEDGSELQTYLERLFLVLNTKDTSGFPKYLQEFPYVNGGLFAEDLPVPQFSAKARKIILECGELNWKAINPDIFGSMIQAVIHDDMRGGLGMHYTSVTNIMKVIEPLFLNDLYEELDKAGASKSKLNKLLNRIYNLKIFDPACGSGNFLIIAYKELCKLEIEIFRKLYKGQMAFRYQGKIKLTQFYGIELDDFAHETAKLSMWLAEHQMNLAFKKIFGETKPTLPLQDGGNIICGNATRLDWLEVCPYREGEEVYILGNPPYLGYSLQSNMQKADLAYVFNGVKSFKILDYISCWFFLAAKYVELIENNAEFAFVSTNSITQGEQVGVLWPNLLNSNLEVSFAHRSFKWSNNARGNAGVICVIIGFRQSNGRNKILFSDGIQHTVNNINPYLRDAGNYFVTKRSSPLSYLQKMLRGNGAVDGGFLTLSADERDQLISKNPAAGIFVRRLYGSAEFINDKIRYCIWVDDVDLPEALKIEEIRRRFNEVKDFRRASRKKATREKARIPHRFAEMRDGGTEAIIIPRVSSERRHYIPIGYVDNDCIILDSAQAVYSPKPVTFAVISSNMHMTWVRAVAGRLKTDYRYSSMLCYNTFPFPKISEDQEGVLEDCVFNILDLRESYSERTLAELYDPDKMPGDLFEAHVDLDLVVEKCYRLKPFESDEERLTYLFKKYEEMINA